MVKRFKKKHSISPNYIVHAVCDSSLNVYNKRKVGKGSVALMWRKHLDNQIIPLQTDDDRIVGIQTTVISNIKPDQRVVVLPETINKAIAACPRG